MMTENDFHKYNAIYQFLFTLGIILFVNCASTKLATNVQGIFTIAKLCAILMISITGFVRLGQGKYHLDRLIMCTFYV